LKVIGIKECTMDENTTPAVEATEVATPVAEVIAETPATEATPAA
jgi:hypothetical protein